MINKLPRSYSRHPAVINACAGVGRAKDTAGKYFLTEEGITIARGTLKIYPELKDST